MYFCKRRVSLADNMYAMCEVGLVSRADGQEVLEPRQEFRSHNHHVTNTIHY